MISSSRITVILLFSLLTSSCIAIKSDKYFDYQLINLESKSKVKTKIFVNYNYFNNYPNYNYNYANKPLADQIVEAIIYADCCEIVNDKSKADIYIDLTISQNLKYPKFTKFMFETSASVLNVIPNWFDVNNQLIAKVFKIKEKNIIAKDYVFEDHSTYIYWLPLIIPAIFMKSHNQINQEVVKSVIFKFIINLRNDGYIVK